MSIKRILSVFLAVIMVLLSAVSVNAAEPSSAEKKLTIIDLSEHNGNVNWSVTSGLIDGAILRIGYRGNTYRQNIVEDKLFSSHLSGVKQYNIPYGIYFYSVALNTTEAIEEANWVIKTLKAYKCKPSMPIFFDMEESIQIEKLTNRERTDIIRAFCKTLNDQGYYAGFYTNYYWITNLLYPADLEQYAVWIAQWASACAYTGKYDMWQYTGSGKMDGINHDVDISYCYKNYPDFIKKYGYNGYTGTDDPGEDSEIDYSKSGTYKITFSYLNVRNGPSLLYDKIGSLSQNDEVYVNYIQDGWGNISYGAGHGWISLDKLYISKTSDYITTKEKLGYYIVSTDVLNVREGYSTDYNKVGQLYKGDSVFITQIKNNWGCFYQGEAKHWICLDYADFYSTVCFITGIDGKYLAPKTIKSGMSFTLPKWNIALDSKTTFKGWALSSGGSVKYSDGASVTAGNSNIALFAVLNKDDTPSVLYTNPTKPRAKTDNMFVVSDEKMSQSGFITKYIKPASGVTYSVKLSDSSYMGTGSEIEFKYKDKTAEKLYVVISGDCNGDGICNCLDLADALNISQGTKSTVSYSVCQKKAADINLDGKVDSADLKIIKNVASGSADLPH